MTKRKPRAYNRKMPENPPAAFQSKLWPHLEEIRALRRARKMWPEITEHLRQTHGIHMTYRAVRNFFIRASKRGGKQPFGFADPTPAPAPAQPAAGAKPAPPAKPGLAQPHAAIEALRGQAKQESTPAEDPEWNIPIDPEKPL